MKATIDKLDGEIQRLVDEKGNIPKDQLKGFIERHLVGYINYVYRSLKTHRDNLQLAYRLEATVSIGILFDVILLFMMDD